jgi:hypothetical protein
LFEGHCLRPKLTWVPGGRFRWKLLNNYQFSEHETLSDYPTMLFKEFLLIKIADLHFAPGRICYLAKLSIFGGNTLSHHLTSHDVDDIYLTSLVQGPSVVLCFCVWVALSILFYTGLLSEKSIFGGNAPSRVLTHQVTYVTTKNKIAIPQLVVNKKIYFLSNLLCYSLR